MRRLIGGRQLLGWTLFVAVCSGQPLAAAEQVELLRDRWGVPHVFAATDTGAFYGLGYATAEDRGFQMYYNLRIIQGRLAELIGDVPNVRRRRMTAVESDRKMRSFGFYRAAQRVAANLDAQSQALLQAYCHGVNDWFAQHREDWHYLFGKLGMEPEPWRPADCIVSWWHMAQFFGPDGTRDLVASRGPNRMAAARRQRPGARRASEKVSGTFYRNGSKGASHKRFLTPFPHPGDEAAAVVTRQDVSDQWLQRMQQFAAEHGIGPPPQPGVPAGPKFSHAWVVGGSKTTTGAAVLVSDPQTMVGNPSMFYEFHISGRTFNARGIGVPGSPIILIGFTDKVAWGMTAIGADQADLFHLKTDPAHPNQYYFDGKWCEMELVTETIRVKGGEPQKLTVPWTRFGPVITRYVFARPEDGQFAVKRVPVCETDRNTLQAAVAMMRADDAASFGQALAGWRFPSANVVFGDRQGSIGYWVIGALPVRSRHAAGQGRVPHDGSRSDHDWQGMLPHELKPHVINPRRGYIFSANHRPIGSFYKLYIGASTGQMGDTLRSWRLRQLFAGRKQFTPQQVLAIHYDTVNAAKRELVRLALHVRDVMKGRLSGQTRRALEHLEGWFQSGASSELTVPGAELVAEISTMFRPVNTELALVHGGGESGLALFLKRMQHRLRQDPAAKLSDLEVAYLDELLRRAWEAAVRKYGPDPADWLRLAQQAVRKRRLGYYQSLDGWPSLDPAMDLAMPALACVDGATIRSQAGQAYTQFVPLHDVDAAQSLLPIGQSERPGSRFRTSTLRLWQQGQLHPAPLSRQAVEAVTVSSKRLTGS